MEVAADDRLLRCKLAHIVLTSGLLLRQVLSLLEVSATGSTLIVGHILAHAYGCATSILITGPPHAFSFAKVVEKSASPSCKTRPTCLKGKPRTASSLGKCLAYLANVQRLGGFDPALQ